MGNEKYILLVTAIAVGCIWLQGCGNWRVEFGVSEFNQNNETRSYTENNRRNNK